MAANDFNVLYRARVSGIPLDNYFFFIFIFHIVQYFNLRFFEQVELLLLYLAMLIVKPQIFLLTGADSSPEIKF